MKPIKPGKFYEVSKAGAVEIEGSPTPDLWICRRVADFGYGQIPGGAAFDACSRCHAPVVYNPARGFSLVPKICMQCGGVVPLPIERS